MKLLLLIIFVFPVSAIASRNCNSECPINFSPSPDPSNPFYYTQQRQRCMSICEQANSQEYELQQQTDEMEKQTQLLEDQLDEQKKLKQQLEEQQEQLDDLEAEQMMDED